MVEKLLSVIDVNKMDITQILVRDIKINYLIIENIKTPDDHEKEFEKLHRIMNELGFLIHLVLLSVERICSIKKVINTIMRNS
jgi:hypothetical protein